MNSKTKENLIFHSIHYRMILILILSMLSAKLIMFLLGSGEMFGLILAILFLIVNSAILSISFTFNFLNVQTDSIKFVKRVLNELAIISASWIVVVSFFLDILLEEISVNKIVLLALFGFLFSIVLKETRKGVIKTFHLFYLSNEIIKDSEFKKGRPFDVELALYKDEYLDEKFLDSIVEKYTANSNHQALILYHFLGVFLFTLI